MNPKKYNEYQVIFRMRKGKMEIIEKIPTDRGSVSIDDVTAELMNEKTQKTKLYYELAGQKNDKEYRKELFIKAKELEINHPKNIKTEELENLIKEKEND